MYISLDQSTSSTTVFLYNNKLKLLDKASKLHKQIHKKSGYVEPDAGHYGIFAGRHWRNNIRPLVLDTMEKI